MASPTRPCPGSWRPVPHFLPGDGVSCADCKRQVSVRPAPVDSASDPWSGAKDPRLEPHPWDATVPMREVVVHFSEG
jgi:hypothetical protein